MRVAHRRRASHVLLALSFVLAGVAVLAPALQGGAQAAEEGSVTRSVTATRSFTDADGNTTEVSSNTVTLTVSQTANLRGRQEVHVSWRGAVPTGGIVNDPHSSDGRNQEYPFVLLQCRGVDSAGAVPAGQVRLSPETCWTQTTPERYLAAGTPTPAWRFDSFATPADRAAVVGAPAELPAACRGSEPSAARWLPIRSLSGEVYYGGPDPEGGCVSLAPETDNAEAGALPANTTYGVTGTDGTGETDFSVWTAAENGTLGCTVSVSCALVAVPIVGLSCDAYGTALPAGQPQTTRTGVPLSESQKAAADASCRRTGAYQPGEPRTSTTSDQAVRGQLWWSASNWRNRITVPLQFAATGTVCDANTTEAPVEILGSVVLNELTASWRPTFCTRDDLFSFTHIQQSDALARTLVESGELDGIFSTITPADGYTRPVVQAPTAFGGFAIAFNIDDTSQRRRTQLKLDARLVAKLLTSSYPAMAVVRDNHPSIGGNPLNITFDPEFQALNPGLPVTSNVEAAAALQIFSSNSDLLHALTSWIDADPEARAWLDGYADPWGMTVNEAYRRIDLPVDSWPLRDSWLAPDFYKNQNPCYGNSPSPLLQLVLNPVSNLGTVVTDMQYSTSSVLTACRFDGSDQNTLSFKQQGRQTVGYRFVLGLVTLSAAARYNLTTAELQTTSSVAPRQQFTDATGRTFVKGDTAGLQAAARLLSADPDTRSWSLDYGALSSQAGAAAYPGAMPVYTVVPTSGLDGAAATKLATLLCYVDGEGQVSGTANGQLPAGYLPLTQPNGLGAQRAYLRTSIAAVRAQTGATPALDAVAPEHDVACDFSSKPVVPTPTPTPTPTPDAPQAPAAVDPAAPVVDAPVAPDAPTKAAPTRAVPVQEQAPVEAAPVLTAGQTSLFGRLGPGGLLVLALATAIAGSLMRWYDVVAATLAALAAGRGTKGGRRR
ncbi:hypothetical protein [Nocardioides rubriscoriae]|uniref:hypothetical protein n=1 Tax=Nocardioides rubriscoriae TaxID=642762 RepID=UPI0011DFAE3E|nr:hypothetical protein [Nocardioides rubriscoriae]